MARVEVSLPRSLGAGPSIPLAVQVDARTVLEAVRALAREHPGLDAQLLSPEGALRRSVAVYLHGNDIRELDEGAETVLEDGDRIEVVPALAGG